MNTKLNDVNILSMTTFDKLNLVNELIEAGELEELHDALAPIEKELITTALIQLSEIEVVK